MKTCSNPKCKTSGIPDDANFCPVCGAKLSTLNTLQSDTSTYRTAQKKQITPTKSSSNSSGGKVAVIIIVILAVIIGVVVLVNNQESNSSSSYTPSYTQPQQTQSVHQNSNQTSSSDYAKDNIRSALSRLSSACSKSGNQSVLSSLFVSEVNPYVSWGATRKAVNIPSATRQFLDRYDYYEVSAPTDLSVKPYNEGYVATYKVVVEWNSQRTGHKKACIQKTSYFDSNYKITRFIDNELWRQSL